MAIPFLIGGAAAFYGGGKTLQALDKKKEAERINKEAQEIADNATKYRENTRSATNYSLEHLGKIKISIMSENMRTFVDNFSQLHNVHFKNSVMLDELRGFDPQSKDFLEMKKASFNASELATGGLGSLAAGTLTAAGAYGAVGLFATASTGTAIAGLSGAAATNATLAWLGGGSIAAGGGGMAAGTLVLGGLVAIPALVIGGIFFNEKMDTTLNEAKENRDKARKYEQEVRNFCTVLKALKDKVEQIDGLYYQPFRYRFQYVFFGRERCCYESRSTCEDY